MTITASNYDRARALLDDPKLTPDRKAKLQAEVQAYETQRQTAGLPEFFLANSADTQEAGGIERPKDVEDYVQRMNVLDDPTVDLSPDARRAKATGTRKYREANPDLVSSRVEEVGGAEQYKYRLKPSTGDTVADDPEAEYARMSEATGEQNKLDAGLDEFDATLPSASQRKSLYAPPEFMPEGGNFSDYATARYYEEPPLAVAKEALRSKLGNAVDDLTEDSDVYKRFADASWKEAYENASTPVLRLKYMTTDTWGKKLAYGQGKALHVAVPLARGADKALTLGAASELALSGLEGESDRRARQTAEANSPISSAAGAVIGSLAPGGAVSRLYSLGSRAAGHAGAGALGSAAAGAALAGSGEVAGSGAVRNLSERAFADKPQLAPGDEIAKQATLSGAISAPFGPLGELIGRAAGWGVTKLRAGELGPHLAAVEKAGMSTRPAFPVLQGAIGKTDELVELEKKAAQSGGRRLEDMLAENVADPVGAEALKRETALRARQAAENAAGYSSKAGKTPRSVDKFAHQVLKELDDVFDPSGRLVPLAESDRKALDALARDVLDVKIVVRGEAPKVVRSYKGGARQVSVKEIERLASRSPAIADMLDDALAAAKMSPWSSEVAGVIRSDKGVRLSMGDHFRVVVAPRKMTDQQLMATIRRMNVLAENATDAEPYKRLLASAMQTRDKFPAPGEPAMRKGDVLVEGNVSARSMRHEDELLEQRALNEALGLPSSLRPAPQRASLGGEARPDLSVPERKHLISTISGYLGAPGREVNDRALLGITRDLGLESDLANIAASNAYRRLTEASSPRAFFGMGGNLSSYVSKPGQYFALRFDPVARALSKRRPEVDDAALEQAISPKLREAVRYLASTFGKHSRAAPGTKALPPAPRRNLSLNPIGDINKAAGLASGRQLGPAAAGGSAGLSAKELEILRRLIDLHADEPRKKKAGGL